MTDATHQTTDGTLLWVNPQGFVTAVQPYGGLYRSLVGEVEELPTIDQYDLIPF